VDDIGDVVVELAAEGTDTIRASISWTLGATIENLVLADSAAVGTGNAFNNQISAGAGSQRLIGLDGNDTLDGGAGADTLEGGLGDDIYFVDNAGDILIELPGEGADMVRASISWTLGAEFENLVLIGGAANGTGNSASNVLTGNAGSNRLDGGGGGDSMFGGLGDDVYVVDDILDRVFETSAAGGVDTVESAVSFTLDVNVENLLLTGTNAIAGIGNAADNIITGNSAANLIAGGLGADVLDGGGGADTFLYRSTAESSAAARDTILAFESGDRIDLSQIDAAAASTGTNEAFTWIGDAGFSGTAGELRVYQVGSDWFVEGDTDGDGAADLAIGVVTTNGHILSAADFLL
jgi:Ca2+-binding RTX toxin-like protein